jgi:hypothetical protein
MAISEYQSLVEYVGNNMTNVHRLRKYVAPLLPGEIPDETACCNIIQKRTQSTDRQKGTCGSTPSISVFHGTFTVERQHNIVQIAGRGKADP